MIDERTLELYARKSGLMELSGAYMQAGLFDGSNMVLGDAMMQFAKMCMDYKEPKGWKLVPVNPTDEQLSHLLSPGEKFVMEQQPLPREVILPLAIKIAGLRELYASMLNSIPNPNSTEL